MNIYIYMQSAPVEAVQLCSTTCLLRSLKGVTIASCWIFLPSLQGVPIAKIWMLLQRLHMYRWIYIYIQRSFGGCSTFLNYLSSPFIERRHYREFLPSLKGVPIAKFWMFLERWNMYRWIYIYTPLVWRLFIFPQLVHWKALLPRIYRYSSLHWNAHLTRFLGYPSPHSKTSLSRKFG